jgi:glycosyltransferase involved in cell wall biosynthesis
MAAFPTGQDAVARGGLSIVLPCYNEAENLPPLLDAYRAVFGGRGAIELVLVDNGSTDDTAAVLRREQERGHPFALQVVPVPVNQGYGHGILAGLAAARGEYLAWSHADRQCSPQDVAALYDAVLKRPRPERCFGKGFRSNRRGSAAFFSRMQSLLARIILGRVLTEINAQPKLFHRSFLAELSRPPAGYELDLYAYYRAVQRGMDVVSVHVEFPPRERGRSKWAASAGSRLRFMARNLWYLVALRFREAKR